MVDCYNEGLVPLLTVHDELCFSISSQKQADKITEIMEQGLELNVPSKVDMEIGKDWGEIS
jgi:DNA polymerase I-like protein with 3'-5' exonuclease and polymerase domains